MAKVPKHRRIKRTTLLIKRTRCIKNGKKPIKTPTPIYQKLKVNNHSLAKALSQERQEYRMLFSRNNELLAEVQDLVHACNKRELVISNILKISKEMMQMLVTMSGFLSNVISSCQEFNSNQIARRTSGSSSSTGRRESSSRRLSAKSPARGVVKPMVSGHTITKPTINLSRVNMPRPPISNLSIIEESSTPERNPDRSGENRRSRGSSERLAVPTHRNEDDEDRAILRRRSSRYSGGRLSSGRFSKRNSGRLSGGSIAGRLSMRGSDSFELPKSPRVTLQDVSRYLTNNQTVNVRMLSETTNGNHNTSSSHSSPEENHTSEPTSPEEDTRVNNRTSRKRVHSVPQNGLESQNTSESEPEDTTVQYPRKSTLKSSTANKSNNAKRNVRFQNRSSVTYDSDDPLEGPSCLLNNSSEVGVEENNGRGNQNDRSNEEIDWDDPLEGPSWLFNNSSEVGNEENNGRGSQNDTSNEVNHNSSTDMEQSSPVSSLSPERRRSSGKFRIPELPKRFAKPPAASRLNLNDELDSPDCRRTNGDTSSRFTNHNGEVSSNEQENDDDDRRVNLCFITQRRGRTNDDDDDDDDDDDETIMLNMRRQLRQPQSQQHQSPEQSERMQFDINDLLQLTPLKSLMNINCSSNNGLIQPEPEPEPTVTVQLTQKVHPKLDESITQSRMSTIKLQPLAPRNQDTGARSSNGQEARRLSELTTTRLSSRIELPRLTELHNSFADDNLHQQSNMVLTPDISNKQPEKRKRTVTKQYNEVRHSESEEEEESSRQKKKKPKQRKKKKSENKDPSSVKVVLQKLNDTQRLSSKSERKNSDESISSARNSMISRADQSSDSECSTNSNNSKPMSTRPRRQKAPKNLAEPNMKKKLRR